MSATVFQTQTPVFVVFSDAEVESLGQARCCKCALKWRVKSWFVVHHFEEGGLHFSVHVQPFLSPNRSVEWFRQGTIDGFHSEVIKLQSQNSEVLRILIYTRLKINKTWIFV